MSFFDDDRDVRPRKRPRKHLYEMPREFDSGESGPPDESRFKLSVAIVSLAAMYVMAFVVLPMMVHVTVKVIVWSWGLIN